MDNTEESADHLVYRTLKGYETTENMQITYAMEDYLEMICRHSAGQGYVRINHLAGLLNVKPSSSSKMVNNLKAMGLVEYEKYGMIKPTPKGEELGRYLLYRHEVIHRFFCLINQSEDELEQTEKVEHFINRKTLHNMERLIAGLEKA